MGFKIGSPYTPYPALPPTNEGLSGPAQMRLNNVVSRSIAKHQNALLVDGNPIYIWTRMPTGAGGPVCSCKQRKTSTSMGANLPVNNSEGQEEEFFTPDVGADDDDDNSYGSFQTINVRGDNTSKPLNISKKLQTEFPQINSPNGIPEELGSEFDETEAPMGFQSNNYNPNDLARFLHGSGGGGLFGGDSTICGICYSTGRVNGYQIVNGGRVLMESSGYWPYTVQGNASINIERFPSVFSVSRGGSISWIVDIPTYVDGWNTIGVIENNKPAYGLILQVFWQNAWVALDFPWLNSTNGQDRSDLKVQVIIDSSLGEGPVKFTHAELRYMTGDPILAQCPQLDFPVDYETEEVLINTEFEVTASMANFPRESYFQDSKFRFIWKVQSVSPKSTALNQIYGYEVSVRRVTSSELQSTMKLLPSTTENFAYTGLQYIQGAVQNDTFPGTKKPLMVYEEDIFVNEDEGDIYGVDGNE